MTSMLSRECVVRMGARRIVLGAAELAQVSQTTINNTDDLTEREALKEIKRHLDAAAAAAKVLADSVQTRLAKQ